MSDENKVKVDTFDYANSIQRIYAEDGFVIIAMKGHPDVEVTMNEAIEHADAIRNMTVEGGARDLFLQLYAAAVAAKVQVEDMMRAGNAKDAESFENTPEFFIKQDHLRKMELFKAKQITQLVNTDVVTV